MSRRESRQCGSAEEKDLDQLYRIDKLKLFQGMVLVQFGQLKAKINTIDLTLYHP